MFTSSIASRYAGSFASALRLVGALGGLHEAFVGLLLVVVDERAGRYVRQQRVPDALRGGLAVAAYDYDGILEGVGRGESPSPR